MLIEIRDTLGDGRAQRIRAPIERSSGAAPFPMEDGSPYDRIPSAQTIDRAERVHWFLARCVHAIE
jgi:hypothetical protein